MVALLAVNDGNFPRKTLFKRKHGQFIGAVSLNHRARHDCHAVAGGQQFRCEVRHQTFIGYMWIEIMFFAQMDELVMQRGRVTKCNKPLFF